MSTIHPNRIGAAARRLAAKMVADPAEHCAMSFTGLRGDPADKDAFEQSMNGPEAAMVVVARGPAMFALMRFLIECGCVEGAEIITVEEP